jgi:LEA14-like dessication related protein
MQRTTDNDSSKSLLLLFIIGLLLVGLSACALKPVVAPEVSLADLQITELSLTHANLLAGLKIYNPNSVGVTIKQVDYTLSLNGIRVSSGQSAKEVSIGAEESGLLNLRLSSAYWDLLRILNQVQTGQTAKFALDGKVKVGGYGILGKTFEFNKEGDISLGGVQP